MSEELVLHLIFNFERLLTITLQFFSHLYLTRHHKHNSSAISWC